MASLLTTQREYRRRLLAADRLAAREMVRVYADLERVIRSELTELTNLITRARAAGETVNQSWLFQQSRYRNLLQQTAEAYAQASRIASGTVTRTQTAAVTLGEEAAEQLVRSLAPPQIPLSWSRLPIGAVESFAGFASDGSPLSRLFDSLGPEASANIRRSLLRGIGLGHNPTRIARDIRRDVGLSLTRALTISRTEVLRSYRQAQSDSYAANKDILRTKIWHSALDERSCVVCISQHGSEWPLDAIMETHPRCRCSWVPVTKTWEQLGYSGIADTNPAIEQGPAWFDRLPIEKQAAILGPGRQAAYAEGLRLEEMVGRRVSRRWGPTRYVLPLRTIRERAAERVA